jgi:hypothetical protein
MGDSVFRGIRAKELPWKQTALRISSEFSVEDSHGKFVDLCRLGVWLEDFIHVQYFECVIKWHCYTRSSCILVVVPGEDQCVRKSAIALYLIVIKIDCNQGANKSNLPN